MTTTAATPDTTAAAATGPVAGRARGWRAVLRNRRFGAGAVLLGLVALLAVAGPPVIGVGPNDTAVSDRLQPPGAQHVLGTDGFGRDQAARLTHALGVSLGVAGAVTAIAVAIALIAGLASAYYRAVDRIVMRVCDALMAIPDILLALAVVAALGPSIRNLIVCLVVVAIPGMARTVRASALSVREATYVEAMRGLGASNLRIIARHILPNAVGPLIVQASAVFSTAIIVEAALSFLGAGVPAPDASLGNLLSDAKEFIHTAWWLTLVPGAGLAAAVLGANLLGDGLADGLDPGARGRAPGRWRRLVLGTRSRSATEGGHR